MAKKGNLLKVDSNLFQGRFYYKENGQDRFKVIAGRSKKDVKLKLEKLEDFFGKDQEIMSFSEICWTWLKMKGTNGLKKNSQTVYEQIIKVYIIPYFKDCNFFEISEKDIIKFESNLIETNPNLSKTEDIMRILNGIIRFYESNYKIPHKNSDVEREILSNRELNQLIEYLECNMNSVNLGILLILYSGISVGELCALKWSDIDLENGMITVNKVASRVSNESNYGYKTKLEIIDIDERKVPISNRIKSFFYDYKSDGYFITNSDNPTDVRALQYKLRRICEKINISKTSFSQLRDTFVVQGMKKGCNVLILSKILGVDILSFKKYYKFLNISEKKLIKEISKVTF